MPLMQMRSGIQNAPSAWMLEFQKQQQNCIWWCSPAGAKGNSTAPDVPSPGKQRHCPLFQVQAVQLDNIGYIYYVAWLTVSSKDWLTGRGSCCSGPVLGMCTGEACSALGCPLSWAADLELEGPRTEANILRHCPLSLYSSRGIFILFSFF